VSVVVGPSDAGDIAAIAEIYGEAVRTGTASFEEIAPDPAELAARRASMLGAGLPHLVARANALVVGFAHAGPFRPRPAYRYTVESSVYVASAARRQGVATGLMHALVTACTATGRRQIIAIVGDPIVNVASVALHERLGFRPTGRLAGVGYKFGRWLDVLLLQLRLDG